MVGQPIPVLVATNSKGKLLEFQWLLGDYPIRLYSLRDLDCHLSVTENSDTPAGNAVLKAVEGARLADMVCLADDSGMEIPALGNAPGVAVRRWQGRLPDDIDDMAWLDFLVEQVRDIPEAKRGAHFRTAVAIAAPSAGGVRTIGVAECLSHFVIRLPPRSPFVPGMPVNSVRYLPEYGAWYNDLPEAIRLQVHRGQLREPVLAMIEKAGHVRTA